ncbi:MAG: SPOR domain-containing protein [Desulfovibrio sp.]
MATLLGVVLIAAVGWSFFMGFMVGRGQNPEQRVEQMTGLQLDKEAQQAAQGGLALQNPPSATLPAGTDPAATAQNGPGAQSADPNMAGPQAAAGTAASAAPAGPETAGPADASAYPFERPNGSSLAAWGIKQPQAGAQPGVQTGAQAGGQAAQKPSGTQASAQAQKPAAPQAPMFDFVYQVAAFKSVDDADKLRKRLEERGIRSRLQKSGKVQLVMVSLRGTELDAANLREELGRMKLGAPMQKSKKAVAGKGRSTGR